MNGSVGRFYLENRTADEYMRKVSPVAWATYCAIVRHADAEGRAWPSVARLVEFVNVSTRSIQYAINDLCRVGLVERQDVHGRPTVFVVKALEHKPQADLKTGVQPVAPHDGSTTEGVQPVAGVRGATGCGGAAGCGGWVQETRSVGVQPVATEGCQLTHLPR